MKLTTAEAGARPRRAASAVLRALLPLVLAAAGILSACADLVGPADAPLAAIPTLNLAAPDCEGGFSQAQCDAIRDALKWLRDHKDPDCKAMGDSATARFNDGKFVHDSTTTDYGYMYTGKDSTWLGDSAFDPGELANTIAHEESHHQGYEDLQDGSGNDAYALGDKCAQPKPSGTSTTPGTPTPATPADTAGLPSPTNTPTGTDTSGPSHETGTYSNPVPSPYPALPAGA